MKDKLIITVELPEPPKNVWGDVESMELYAKVHKFKKWWKFWQDNYVEMPLRIINMESEPEADCHP